MVQAFASTIIWVVGFSTIADNVQPEHMGKSYGAISMAVGIGTSTGPLLSGMLFQLGGYWLAWSSAFTIIIIDVILRLLMLERPTNTGAGEYRNSHIMSNKRTTDLNTALKRLRGLTATPAMRLPTQRILLFSMNITLPLPSSLTKRPV